MKLLIDKVFTRIEAPYHELNQLDRLLTIKDEDKQHPLPKKSQTYN